jgi:uncharacterized surface protein with fasciclin (FAS1) repeats
MITPFTLPLLCAGLVLSGSAAAGACELASHIKAWSDMKAVHAPPALTHKAFYQVTEDGYPQARLIRTGIYSDDYFKVGMGYKAKKDIVDTAVAAGSFNTLVSAVKAAGLVDTLKGAGPFTVFAPTDEAFGKLPKGQLDALLKDKNALSKVLTYHVVPGKVLAKDVTALSSAKTVEGQSIDISTRNGVKVNNANVIKTDVLTSNGVIHVIDSVILPPDMATRL